MRARLDARAVQVRRQAFVQNFVDQRRFSAARDARDACHYAQRYFYVHIPQIVLRGAFDLDEMAVALAAVFRHLDFFSAGEILPRNAAWRLADILHRTFRHQLAAVYARARADVHDPVRLTHGLFVVLHHDERIAQVAQALERGDEL